MKKILFTGARGGITESVIQKLINEDYFIYVTVHTQEQLKEVKNKYKTNNNVECFKLDITSKKDREKIKSLDIDVLVSNAAIGYGGSIIDIDITKLRENFEVNVFSSFQLIQEVLKNMLKKDSGKIIIVSSIAGVVPLRFLGSYCASKSSLIKLTQTLKKELKLLTKNIRISLVLPGMYHTGFNQVMLENKYPNISNSVFSQKENDIRFWEDLFWNTFEYKSLKTITKKIYKSITTSKSKFIYSAPLNQKIFAKIYQIFNW